MNGTLIERRADWRPLLHHRGPGTSLMLIDPAFCQPADSSQVCGNVQVAVNLISPMSSIYLDLVITRSLIAGLRSLIADRNRRRGSWGQAPLRSTRSAARLTTGSTALAPLQLRLRRVFLLRPEKSVLEAHASPSHLSIENLIETGAPTRGQARWNVCVRRDVDPIGRTGACPHDPP